MLSASLIKYIYRPWFYNQYFFLSVITFRDCKNSLIFDKIEFIIFNVTRKQTTIDGIFYNQEKQNKSYKKRKFLC